MITSKNLTAFFALVLCSISASAQIITTIAGTGTAGFSGDGGPATAAQINSNWGMARDASGNIYIGDFGNNRIRKISPAGIITTYAGNGSSAASGDGGPATAAGLSVTGVATHGTDVYFADVFSSRIRKINAAGIITTVAGNGVGGYSGDGGPATAASISNPNGLWIDPAGNIYIPDQGTNYVRKVNTAGIINRIAGSGVAGFSGDGGPATLARFNLTDNVAVDPAGNVFVTDWSNDRLRRINTSGIINTYVGTGTLGFSGDGGSATAANVRGPTGIDFDGAGGIFLCDVDNHRIRKTDAAGIITTIAGTGAATFGGDGGPATAAQLHRPVKVVWDGTSKLYISDRNNNRIRMIEFTVVVTNVPPSFTGGVSQSLTLCENAPATSINTLLAITDPDIGQTETWSLLTAPLHGTAVVAYTITSTGGTLTPTGLTYTPATGYTGLDSFKVSVTDGTGADTITIYVTIDPLPVAGTISGPSRVCAGANITLTSSVTGGTWSSSNPAVATVTAGGSVSGVSAGTTVISYTVSNSCGTAAATHTVTVDPLPAIGTIDGRSPLCMGAVVTFTNSAAGGTWSSSNPAVATIGSSSGVVTAVGVGSTTITYTISTFGCTNTAIFSLAVTTASILKLFSTVASVKCNGDSNGSINITVSGGTGPYVYSWSNGATVATQTGLPAGLYSVQVTDAGINCTGNLNVAIVAPAVMEVDGTATNDLCDKGIGTISISVTGGETPYSYLWSFNDVRKNVTGLTAGTYTVTVTDKNQCKKMFSATVNADFCAEITIHDVITPNGDGLNDMWVIEGLSNYTGNSVQLFDKWGDLVYRAERYMNDFSGTGIGGDLPDGTYFYLVKLNSANPPDGKNEYTGSLLIKR
ncbi:MAG: hypothetical protein K0Q79_3304 [Flavipsychrobacter sp.]|jgi:gliding motility-associated-like protein|nr:hypothetical protein [Flavipsychrobacter sp.]